MAVRAILEDLRERLGPIYGDALRQLVLYGSRARDDWQDGSDIDVLVVLQGPVSPCNEIKRTAEVVSAVSLEHNVVVACVFVSDEQYRDEQSPLLINVRREGTPV